MLNNQHKIEPDSVFFAKNELNFFLIHFCVDDFILETRVCCPTLEGLLFYKQETMT